VQRSAAAHWIGPVDARIEVVMTGHKLRADTIAVLALLCLSGCKPADPLDRTLPADAAGQAAIEMRLAQPDRGYFRAYLTEVRGRQASPVAPETLTIREAIDQGKQRMAELDHDRTSQNEMMFAAQRQAAMAACAEAADRPTCVARQNELLARKGVPARYRLHGTVQ
jgi:hypothetical protein